MKSSTLLFLTFCALASCHSPEYFVQKGDYDRAIELYSSNIGDQRKGRQHKKDLIGLESAFGFAQRRDSAELALLAELDLDENWPRINKIHRQIQARQQKLSAHGSFQSKKGFVPMFTVIEAIDSLEADSRRLAAAYLFNHAQGLLAITDSTGQRQPARDAYRALCDLKDNYFPSWENTNALIDSAFREGKAHVLLETSVVPGVWDGSSFWNSIHLAENIRKSEWLAFYTDPTARARFDFRAKCRLVSLYIGPENTFITERTETREVEDGFDEKLDSAGFVISRTPRFKTEYITICTYHATRSANGTVLIELIDEHTGQLIHEQAIEGSHNSCDSSELFRVSAPSHWYMVGNVASSIKSSIHWHLRKLLLPK